MSLIAKFVLVFGLNWLMGTSLVHAQLERMNIGYSAQAGAFAPIWITIPG